MSLGWEAGEHPCWAEEYRVTVRRRRLWRPPLPPGVPYADFPVGLLAADGRPFARGLGISSLESLGNGCLPARSCLAHNSTALFATRESDISDAFPPGSS